MNGEPREARVECFGVVEKKSLEKLQRNASIVDWLSIIVKTFY